MNYKDLLATTMQPLNDAVKDLGISVLNFNARRVYSKPNNVNVVFFCEVVDEQSFILPKIKRALLDFGLEIQVIEIRNTPSSFLAEITCEGLWT